MRLAQDAGLGGVETLVLGRQGDGRIEVDEGVIDLAQPRQEARPEHVGLGVRLELHRLGIVGERAIQMPMRSTIKRPTSTTQNRFCCS